MENIKYKIRKKMSKIPTHIFLKIQYFYHTRKKLNLDKPVGFNEKIQWLKLNDKKEFYTSVVDKYKVREYVKGKIGAAYLVPLIGVYNKADEIKWDTLPNSFVLKCNHGSGCNIICPDKKNLSIEQSIKKLDKWMQTDFYEVSREWPYKNVERRIVCETFLENDIFDYKFYCFNGIPEFLYVSQGDNSEGTLHMDFYDLKWNKCNFYRKDHKALNFEHQKPQNFNEMIDIAKKLSEDFNFVRVDLFNVSGKLYFSELTLTPGGGLSLFHPKEWEENIGNMIDLNKI